MAELDAFDRELAQQSEQGSPLWFDIRIGRFTSSEIYRLIKPGERLMTDEELKARPKTGPGSKSKWTEDPSRLSIDGESYVYEVVAEVLTGQMTPNVKSYATEHGEEFEPYAAEFYENKFGVKTEIISFVPFGDHAGGSPDRIVGDSLLEIKCPYNSAIHLKYMMLTDQYDLKREYPNYYWQIQSNLLWTGKKKAIFVSYDFRFTKNEHKMATVEILPDSKDMDIISTRVAAAIKMKLQIIETLSFCNQLTERDYESATILERDIKDRE